MKNFYRSVCCRAVVCLAVVLAGSACTPRAAPVVIPASTNSTPLPAEPTRAAPLPTATSPEFTPTTIVDATPDVPTGAVTPSPTGEAQTCQAAGTVDVQQIDSPVLGQPLRVRIYRPPCYDPAHPGGYPVLYLLHGQTFSDTMWIDLGIDKTADRLIQSGQIPPLLIVMPREEQYLQDITESLFDDAVLQTLLPWVDAHEAICAKRACRAIGGISRGALWALKIGMSNWQLFISVGAHSTPEGPFSYAKNNIIKSSIPAGQEQRIYLDSGNEDYYHSAASRYEDVLTKVGFQHEWHVFDGGHNAGYWKAHVEDYLRWYSAGWQ